MKKVILVDMDGVLVDLTATWLRIYGERTGDWVHPDEITAYEFEQFVEYPMEFFSCLGQALEEATPTAGSSKFEDLYLNPDYEVYVVSYAHSAAPEAHKAKLEWLAKYFPGFPQDRVIFTKHKHLIHGDYLIEDSPRNCEDWGNATDGFTIIVDQPYNQGYDADGRAPTFAAVPKIIDGIEAVLNRGGIYATK